MLVVLMETYCNEIIFRLKFSIVVHVFIYLCTVYRAPKSRRIFRDLIRLDSTLLVTSYFLG